LAGFLVLALDVALPLPVAWPHWLPVQSTWVRIAEEQEQFEAAREGEGAMSPQDKYPFVNMNLTPFVSMEKAALEVLTEAATCSPA
jgi:hypothetical protein